MAFTTTMYKCTPSSPVYEIIHIAIDNLNQNVAQATKFNTSNATRLCIIFSANLLHYINYQILHKMSSKAPRMDSERQSFKVYQSELQQFQCVLNGKLDFRDLEIDRKCSIILKKMRARARPKTIASQSQVTRIHTLDLK